MFLFVVALTQTKDGLPKCCVGCDQNNDRQKIFSRGSYEIHSLPSEAYLTLNIVKFCSIPQDCLLKCILGKDE